MSKYKYTLKESLFHVLSVWPLLDAGFSSTLPSSVPCLFFPKTACQVFDALMALIVLGSSGPVFYRIFELFFEMVVSTVVLRFLEETQS